MSRLNRDLEHLYELLYSEWRTVTKSDYAMFGGQIQLLIETLGKLHQSLLKMPKSMGLRDEAENLFAICSALSELNNDIVNFVIEAPNDEQFKQAFAEASRRLNA